jgi:hypothetical protein
MAIYDSSANEDEGAPCKASRRWLRICCSSTHISPGMSGRDWLRVTVTNMYRSIYAFINQENLPCLLVAEIILK